MKNPLFLCSLALIVIVAIAFSCRRLEVPIPPASCFQVTRSSAAGTDSQAVAVNSPIIPITYTVAAKNISTDTSKVDTILVNVTGALPPGVTTSYVNGVFTISGTPTSNVGSPFNYTLTTTGTSCNTGTISGSITVTTCGTINLTSATSSNAQTVTINTPISTPIRYILGGGATGASVIGMPAGVSRTVVGNVLTISGTPTSSSGSPYTYTVTTTGGACKATATGTITVIATGLSPVVSCGGSTSNAVTFNWTAVPGATSYNISYVINPPGSVVNQSTTATTYAVTGLAPGNNVQITVTPVGSGTYLPQSITCTAMAACSAATISYAIPFCGNYAVVENVTMVGIVGGTYSSAAGLTINAVNGGITASTSTPGTYVVDYYTGTCTATALVIINAAPTATIDYGGPYSESIDAAVEPVTQTGTTGGTYFSTVGLTINSATGAITPSTSTAGTYTVTYIMAAEGGCSAQIATTTVTINP